MSEWTARRLDDLPDGTVIAWEESGITVHAAIADDSGWVIGGDRIRDRQNILIWASPGSTRVVSAPINALLTDEAIRAATPYPELQTSRTLTRVIIRDAIAHITGEES